MFLFRKDGVDTVHATCIARVFRKTSASCPDSLVHSSKSGRNDPIVVPGRVFKLLKSPQGEYLGPTS